MTFNALIKAAFAQNLVIDAMKYYSMATRSPDLERVNINWCRDLDEIASTVVSGFLTTQHYEEAEHFLNDATVNGRWHNTTPKPFIYFINWFARHGRLDEAWNLFDFHKNKFDKDGTFKLKIAVLKSIFLDRGDIYGGERWIRELQNEGSILEQPHYYDFLSAAMFNGEREIAEQMWEEVTDLVARQGQRLIVPLIKLGRHWGLDLPTNAI